MFRAAFERKGQLFAAGVVISALVAYLRTLSQRWEKALAAQPRDTTVVKELRELLKANPGEPSSVTDIFCQNALRNVRRSGPAVPPAQ